MTTSLSFMFQGHENRINMEKVDSSTTFAQLTVLLRQRITEENIAIPEGVTSTRLICFGKVLKPEDEVGTLINPNIDPPYTVQVSFKKDEPESIAEDHSCCSSGACMVQ